ncbi:uncharacterized protein C1orf194 isoform X2 [Cephus cinctus]|nr:uncharacterized protein C1orf194 isoform X2 [Cephus cinctus]XP_015590059.1 uncharacterized protein C1orf194 isoform X2 [Cephus cinctus]
MSNLVTVLRNPYPIPDISREGIWVSHGPVLGENVSVNDRRWYARLKPHERLFAHHTLNSIRKDHRLIRPKVPQDSLDLALSSIYKHDADTLVPKTYVPMQPETLGKETWRVLRNQIKTYSKPPSLLGHPVKYARPYQTEDVASNVRKGIIQRIHPSSVKLAIEGPHTDQTNPGYSRKVDGTFYSI